MQRAAVPGKCILRGPPQPESRKLKQNVTPNFKELEDLSALNALYRPGPLDGGMIDEAVALAATGVLARAGVER